MAARLKLLEMYGYKTFASRTIFAFPDEITAVVGPNGSGKSNIADAIRWVLGEQAYSLLRGRKTEDMIFSGSDQRPRANMASATITFENENGWLPIDYSEVSITRRAYRDGQNEYLLNGQRVRLKEISELLAQSGLAERTYTIIGQGLVDAALSLKPEERRRFFEEAAGIGLYRSRRDEAISRLDNTQRNLERVEDILSELEPRLQSLERQARRVQEYERIKADLKLLLREWYGYHFHHSQAELTRTREVLRMQEERLEHARGNLQQVDYDLSALRSRLQELRSELNEWHTHSAGLHQSREKISRSLAVLDERQRSLSEQSSALDGDIASLEEEAIAGSERLTTLQNERAWLQNELDEARQQFALAEAALLQRQEERRTIELHAQKAREALVACETRQVQLHAHQSELMNRQETLTRSRQSLQQSLIDEEKTIQEALIQQEKAHQDQSLAADLVRHLEDQLQTLRAQINQLENERRTSQQEFTKLESEKTRAQAQLEVIEQAEKSYAGLSQGTQFLMQAAHQGKLRGNFRALSSFIEVPAVYETALAAAFGEFWDAIVIDQPDHLEDALLMLAGGEKGRAVLIPLSSTRSAEPLPKPDAEGVIGIASGLVGFPAEIAPAVKVLLDQVLVVADHQVAKNLARNLPPSMRIVTLQGETFWGSGLIQAGRDNKSAVVSRPRVRRELIEGLAEIKQRLDTAQANLDRKIRDLDDRHKQRKDTENRLHQANQQMSRTNQQAQQADLAVEKVRQRQSWQHSQLESLNSQLNQAAADLQQTLDQLDKSQSHVNECAMQLRVQNRSLAECSLDETQAQAAHWSTNSAVAQRALAEADRRLDEHRLATESNLKQRQSLANRQESIRAALNQLEVERKQLRTEENELNSAIQSLQVQIQPAEADLERLEKEHTHLQENQVVAQQAVAVAERYTTQAQLELGRTRDSMDSLRRRIEEDFGLVAYDYAADIAGPTPLPLEGMVEELPTVKELPPEIEDNINRQRAQLRRMGSINIEAQAEYEAVRERYHFLTTQVDDLRQADIDLRQVILELDELMRIEFRKTFDAVAAEFRQLFTRLFGGGTARLILTDSDNPNESGIEIETRLPGRREQGLSLLSGGERSLTAVALVFALLKVSPTPFCVLDEVDAMLDEANVGRFRELLVELSQNTQFIVITHNRNTVQAAGVIYGITMGRDSTSQMISLRLDEVDEEMAK